VVPFLHLFFTSLFSFVDLLQLLFVVSHFISSRVLLRMLQLNFFHFSVSQVALHSTETNEAALLDAHCCAGRQEQRRR